MQISAANPQRAKVFINGKWSEWMDRDEAQTLEDEALWGKGRKDGIYPLAVAQRLQITPASAANTGKGTE